MRHQQPGGVNPPPRSGSASRTTRPQRPIPGPAGATPTPTNARELGKFGEDLAATVAAEIGLEVIERNWRSRWGEIDLVCTRGRQLVFVEVKTRSSNRCGIPETAITERKLARLHTLAAQWRTSHSDFQDWHYRLDVLAIDCSTQPIQIRHLAGVG